MHEFKPHQVHFVVSVTTKLYTHYLILVLSKFIAMVADNCYSYFRPATPPSEKSRINKLKWRGRRTMYAYKRRRSAKLIKKIRPLGPEIK
jgi:hypothetical protein